MQLLCDTPKSYVGESGYMKMYSRIYYMDVVDDDTPIRVEVTVAKAEPILDENAELIGWAWYSRKFDMLPGTKAKLPKFMKSLRSLVARVQKIKDMLDAEKVGPLDTVLPKLEGDSGHEYKTSKNAPSWCSD